MDGGPSSENTQLTLEQYRFQWHRSNYARILKINVANIFSLIIFILTFLSLAVIVRIQYEIHITYKIRVNMYLCFICKASGQR